ncbi:MAG: hypothetical protein RIR46_900 [Actinomycetota bacterium]|jgi:hypothetical protein
MASPFSLALNIYEQETLGFARGGARPEGL